MRGAAHAKIQTRLIARLNRMCKDEQDRVLLGNVVRELNARYGLIGKMAKEPGVEEILTQMVGRLAHSFGRLSEVRDKSILDIACGSNTSRAPASLYIDTPLGETTLGRASESYTAQFEPWFCRILLELGAHPVGIDFGNLDGELFIHYGVDLGQIGALDFLPDKSFDAVQDSRLFGSPEFTAEFPMQADRLNIALEIKRQEQRLLKLNGIIIHSDAAALLR
jgi:hypothetical protein